MISKIRVTFLVALAIFFPQDSGADTYPIESRKLFMDQPSGLIRALHQGKNSLWIGSENGLYSVTGNFVQHFNSVLPSDEINDLFEDRTGRLWISTERNGLYTLLTSNMNVEPFLLNNAERLANTTKIIEYGDSVLVASGSDLISIDIDNGRSSLFSDHFKKGGLTLHGTIRFDADANGNIWFTTGHKSIYRLDAINLSITEHLLDNSDLRGEAIDRVHMDAKSNLWLGTNRNIFILPQGGVSPQKVQVSKEHETSFGRIGVMRFFEDSSGHFWVLSDALYKFDESSFSLNRAEMFYPLLSSQMANVGLDLEQANADELLLSTGQFGLVTIPSFGNALSYLSVGNEIYHGGLVASAIQSDNRLIFATGRELFSYDLGKQSIIKISDQIGYPRSLLAIDENNILIIDINGDAHQYNFVERTLINLDLSTHNFSEVHAVLKVEDDFDSLVLSATNASGSALYRGSFSGGFKVLKDSVKPNILLSDADSITYMVESGVGVSKLSKKGQWMSVNGGFDFSGIEFLAAEKSKSGNIWLATNGEGLAFLSKGSTKLEFLDIKHTAESKFVRGVAEDSQGYLWITTNKGLVRFNPDDKTSISIGKESGVVDVDFEYDGVTRLPDEKILVVGDKLKYIIQTRQANDLLNKRLQQTTEVKLVDLRVTDDALKVQQNRSARLAMAQSYPEVPLQLRHSEYLFSIGFAVNNYAERDNFRFEYRLLGLGNEWLMANGNDTAATFSTLPAGDYEFQVRAIDSRSLVEQPATSLNIKVLPPIWLTRTAYVVYFTLALCIVFALYKLRVRRFKKEKMQLEDVIAKRTADLTKSNIHVSSLLEQKRTLFANVSHELRTPLALIAGPMQRLMDNCQESKLSHQYELIYRNALRLTNLVDQLLELERLEVGQDIPKSNYPVAKSLRLVVESFTPLAEAVQQHIVLDIDGDGVSRLITDSLEKIVSNLLGNAIKYNCTGGEVHVSVTCKQEQLHLIVRDQGRGIQAQQLPRIFDRFVRVEGSENIPGAGVGLALVKELVEANKGTISVQSEVDKGATFTVILPLLRHGEADTAKFNETIAETIKTLSFHQTDAEDEESAIDPKSATLLIIEDNPDMRQFISEIFAENYQCILAGSGAEGLQKAHHHLPDLIISDVMMEGMDGFELASIIRNTEITSHIPIIMLTAKGDEQSRHMGFEQGVDDYIIKPFNPAELKLRVARSLGIRSLLRKRYGIEVSSAMQPEGEQSSQVPKFSNAREEKFYQRFVSAIEENFKDPGFSRARAATLLAISERQLNRKLGAMIDYNFNQYLRKYRLSQAQQLLAAGGQITEVSYDVGYGSPSYFSNCFKAEFGCSPSEYVESSRKQSLATKIVAG